jgi:hypothetical protein
MRAILFLGACWLVLPASVLAAENLAAISFRPEGNGLAQQAATAIGIALVLLALASGLLLALRRRLVPAASTASGAGAGALRCIASLRLPPQTRVHVIAYRDREWLMVQAGDRLQCLPCAAAASGAGAAPREAA